MGIKGVLSIISFLIVIVGIVTVLVSVWAPESLDMEVVYKLVTTGFVLIVGITVGYAFLTGFITKGDKKDKDDV